MQSTDGKEEVVITRMCYDRCLGELKGKGDYLNNIYFCMSDYEMVPEGANRRTI